MTYLAAVDATRRARRNNVFKRGTIQGIGLALAIVLWIGMQTPAYSQGSGPEIGPWRVMTPDPIERYAPFEVAFDITNSVATNPYWPYETNPPAGVQPAAGINVDMSLLPPGSGDWARALTLPCFYYQPVEAVGRGRAGGPGAGWAGGVALPLHAGAGRRVAISRPRDGCGRDGRERRGEASM